MKLRKLSGFAKPSEAMILAIIFAITLALFAFQILPGFDEINPYDETKYVDSGRNLLSGDLRELARGPLVAFLYAPLYLAFRDSPDWFIIIDGIGRLMLFSGLWISSIYVASRLKSYVHPLVIAGVLLCSSYPVWLLRNPSDALFSTFSALTLGKTLTFRHTGRARDLVMASLMLGLAGASRPDGVFLLPFFVIVAILLGKGRIGLAKSFALGVLPSIAVLAAFIIARGIGTGSYSTEIGSKGLSTLYWSEGTSPVAGEAEEVYGTWQDNQGSFIRAISRSPRALQDFFGRVRANASQLPSELLMAYGKRLGPATFILAALGALSLIRKREWDLLLIFAAWPLYSLLYLGFYLRPGFLLMSHFVPLSLAAIGAADSFSIHLARKDRLVAATLPGLLLVYGLLGDKPGFWATGILMLAVMAVAWTFQAIRGTASDHQAIGLLLLLSAGIILRGGYTFPGRWSFGESSMEKAIHFVQQHLPPRSGLATYEPLPAVAAGMEYVDLRSLPTGGEPPDDFERWASENDVDALIIAPKFIRDHPLHWAVIQDAMIGVHVEVFDPGSIRVLFVQE